MVLNQRIYVAVAEKLSVLRTEQALEIRAARVDWPRILAILARIGQGNLPQRGRAA